MAINLSYKIQDGSTLTIWDDMEDSVNQSVLSKIERFIQYLDSNHTAHSYNVSVSPEQVLYTFIATTQPTLTMLVCHQNKFSIP